MSIGDPIPHRTDRLVRPDPGAYASYPWVYNVADPFKGQISGQVFMGATKGVWLVLAEGEMFAFAQEVEALREAMSHQPCKVQFVKFGEGFWR